MLSKKIEAALVEQLNAELYSAYAYFDMASFCSSIDLDGAEHWMLLQAEEELDHARRIYQYISGREGRALMKQLPEPRASYNSLLDVFEESLKQERHLQETLNSLAALALSENDNTTHTFLNWFLSEQVEEIDSCLKVIQKLKLGGETGVALLMINDELGRRVAAPAAPTQP